MWEIWGVWLGHLISSLYSSEEKKIKSNATPDQIDIYRHRSHMYRKANRFFLCIVAAIVLLYSPLPILFFLLLFSATGLYSREGERGWKGINILLPWVSATRMGVVAETHLKTPFFFYNNTKKKKQAKQKCQNLF